VPIDAFRYLAPICIKSFIVYIENCVICFWFRA